MIEQDDDSIEPIQFQTVEDPELRGRLYFEKHQLLYFLQEIASEIATEKPEDPRGYMVNQISEYILQQESENFEEKPSEGSGSLTNEYRHISQPDYLIEELYQSNDAPSPQESDADADDESDTNTAGITVIISSHS